MKLQLHSTELLDIIHMNVQNLLLMFHDLVCSWTVQLALSTALTLANLYDNRACAGMSYEWKYRYHSIT